MPNIRFQSVIEYGDEIQPTVESLPGSATAAAFKSKSFHSSSRSISGIVYAS